MLGGIAMDSIANTAFNEALVSYNRGNQRLRLGDWFGAIRYYNCAIHNKSDFVAAYNNRGTAKAELGDIEEAIADYSHAIELDPQLASAYSNRSRARSELGDNQGAAADYYRAIKINIHSDHN
jgi:tetratricopeptide (TPR) repeat protein